LPTVYSAQDLQLYYQIAINGQKDMSLSPSEQIGLEMTLLRMITFHPNYEDGEKKNLNPTPSKSLKRKITAKRISEPPSTNQINRDISNKEINHLDIKNPKMDGKNYKTA